MKSRPKKLWNFPFHFLPFRNHCKITIFKIFSIFCIFSRFDYPHSSAEFDCIVATTTTSGSTSFAATQSFNREPPENSTSKQVGPFIFRRWFATSNHASSRGDWSAYGTHKNYRTRWPDFGSNWNAIFRTGRNATPKCYARRLSKNIFNVEPKHSKHRSRYSWNHIVDVDENEYVRERWVDVQAVAVLSWKRFCSKVVSLVVVKLSVWQYISVNFSPSLSLKFVSFPAGEFAIVSRSVFQNTSYLILCYILTYISININVTRKDVWTVNLCCPAVNTSNSRIVTVTFTYISISRKDVSLGLIKHFIINR